MMENQKDTFYRLKSHKPIQYTALHVRAQVRTQMSIKHGLRAYRTLVESDYLIAGYILFPTKRSKMPTPGLSLVGFLDQISALSHLRAPCLPNPTRQSDQDLISDWQSAQAQLGAPFAGAGLPQIQPINLSDPHLTNLLCHSPWAADLQAAVAAGAMFCEIEIDPLLAFQLTVDIARSNHHCSGINGQISRQELLDLCLPIQFQQDQVHFSGQNESAIIRCRNLNLRLNNRGVLTGLPNAIGVQFSWAMPLVHVVRYNGRCYLHNGFHRTYGAKLAGAQSVPCIFRDVGSPEEVGIHGHGITLSLLESRNPPTLGHFTQGRAWPVDLRTATRIIHVSWSEHVLYEE